MKRSTKKLISATILLIIVSGLIIFSSLAQLEEKREAELAYQKLLKEQQAIEEAKEKALQKIYITGKFEPAERSDFVQIPEAYNVGGYTMYLRRETLEAFLSMQKAAKENGVDLKIASATRNFDYQKNIWNNKWSGATLVEGKNLAQSEPDEFARFKKILEYSATPGTSRHHFGTDIDINNANAAYFKTAEGKKVYEWLFNNAGEFGFCQPYNLKGSGRTTGYEEEKWHWSYLPLSGTFTKQYKNLITDLDIEGFLGDEYVPLVEVIDDYVFGINPACL